MLTPFLATLILAQAATPVPGPVITFRDGFFLVTEGQQVTRVNSKTWKKPRVTSFELKDRKSVVSWGAAGLTVKTGSQSKSSRFGELPLLPKFFSPEELAETRSKLAAKSITKEASALSGFERLGDQLYLLARWEDKAKKPWLEMIVKIDLTKTSPWFEPVAVVSGLSTAKGSVDDVLFRTGQGLGMVVERDGEWGISRWNLREPATETVITGQYPRLFDVNADGTIVRFVEKTTYGTQLAGVVRVATAERVNLAENRSPLFFPGDTADIVQINGAKGVTLRNTESGLELRLPTNVGVRNVPPGVLVWVPRDNPTQAVLYSRSGLRAVSRWTKPFPAPPARRPQTGKP